MLRYFNNDELVGWCFGFGVLDVFIIVSNIFVIVVFMCSKLLWKCMNYFLLCLFIVDIMVGMILLLLFIYWLVVFVWGEILKSFVDIDKILMLMDIFLGFVLVFVLIIIFLECLYLVVFLSWYWIMFRYIYFILLVGIWMLVGMFVCIKIFVY